MNDTGVEAWAALLRVHAALVPVLDRELQAACGLPLTWYDVLLELNAAPGRQLRMQDLAARVVLSRTRVSRLVSELERVGYIERVPDPDDGRATLARITTEGRAARRQAAPVYLAGIEEHFTRHLTHSQQQAITTGLQRVIDAHDAQADPRR